MGKSPLSGLSPCLFLFWFVPCFYSIFVSLLYCWPYLSLFLMPKKVHMWVFGVWCPLPFVGDVSVPLWGFGSKNLIGPVWLGKPLGLFNVTRPYASQALDGEAGTIKPVPGLGSSTHFCFGLPHGEFRKNFNSFGRGKCISTP